MLRQTWQKRMIALARAPRVRDFMQSSRATSFLRRKYVAGADAADGVRRAMALLRRHGIRSSLF